MQKRKGISLIVLSITILVMAILAATAIIALEDSGIIGRAKNTTKNTNYSEEYTRLQVIKNGILTDNLGEITLIEYVTELENKGLVENKTANSDGSMTVKTTSGLEVTLSQNGISDIGIEIDGYIQAGNTNNNSNSNNGSESDTGETPETTNPNAGVKLTLPVGAGTSANPYQIQNIEHFTSFASKVNAGYSTKDVYIRLETDLDLSDVSNWVEMGNSERFAFEGEFDGYGYTISYLTSTNGGLFGYSYGTIKNIRLGNFDVSKNGDYMGSLIGKNYGAIENCYTYDSIVEGINYVGGLVGINGNGSNISNSSVNNCTIIGQRYVGGCLGENASTVSDASVSDCTITANSIIGGFAGGNIGEIVNCILDGMSQFTFVGQNSGILEDCTIDGAVANE